MLNLKIKDELPIKYHLNMHLMESFIERDSIGFELIAYVINDIASNENKDLTIDNMKFTSRTLKYVFGDKMKDETFKEYVVNNLKEMINMKWIKPTGKSMHITEKMITNFYTIN